MRTINGRRACRSDEISFDVTCGVTLPMIAIVVGATGWLSVQ
jgi:hypothetical protein